MGTARPKNVTVRPRSSRKKLVSAILIIAVIAAGITTFFLFFNTTTAAPDFSLTVMIGTLKQASSQWTPITNSTTFLNGTTVNLVVTADSLNGFNASVQLSFTSPTTGVTGSMPQNILHPCVRCLPSSTGLNMTIASNILAQKGSYKFNVTGTSGSTRHSVIFPLRIWSSTLHVTPSSTQVLKPNTFTVSIGVSDFYNFQGFQFVLHYNNSVVRAVNDTLAPIFYPTGTHVNGTACVQAGYSSPCLCSNLVTPCDGFVALNTLNNTIGRVSVAATLLGPCITQAPCVDSPSPQVFTFVNVTFAADLTSAGSSGSSGFRLSSAILTDLEGSVPTPFSPPSGFYMSGRNATIAYRSSSESLNCSPSTVLHGSMTKCTVTVTDTSPGTPITPSGTITFGANSTMGTFSSGTCTLNGSGASASCFVMYTPNVAGAYLITAMYTGDVSHAASSIPPFDLAAT